MSKISWNSLLASPAMFGAALIASAAVAAEAPVTTQVSQAASDLSASIEIDAQSAVEVEPRLELAQAIESAPSVSSLDEVESFDQLNQYSREGRGTVTSATNQVTSVSQLSDVQPTDWAFQALQSLVERYGCIAGYPDGTYRGNRAMTRYEFAAGLNACMDRMNELIVTAVADFATKEDLAILERLQEEFRVELTALRGRVDSLEGRIAFLEETQFSTTTKLTGEAIMALSGASSFNDGNINSESEIVFQGRVRLNFNTSFNGEDLLITRLQAGNASTFGGFPEGTQTYQVFGDTGNTFVLDTLQYQFQAGERARIYVTANAGIWDDMANTLNPYFEDFDGGSGSLSAFAQRNPIYRLGGGAGIGMNYDFTDNFQVTLGYLAGNAGDPSDGEGLFNGNYSTLAQLTYTSDDSRFGIGLTYNNAYFNAGQFAFDNAGFGGGFAGTAVANLVPKLDPVSTNSGGVQSYYQFSPGFALTGFVGYTNVRSTTDDSFDNADIWYYALGAAFPDLGKEGSLGGIFFGAQPYITDIDDDSVSTDAPLHLEMFYKYQLTDFISITPGFIWQFNPNQDSDNDDSVIGTLRTTFLF
jgi:hypothetical protein